MTMNTKMQRSEMGSTQEGGSDFSMISKDSVLSWSSGTNWVIAYGSLEDSVTIESFDCPIAESGPETTTRKSPLVLKPCGPDSGPCEIKICFQQKYEISQIYVRSTARVYEVYYAHSSHSSNEYLCTVRCGVAERDEKLLQTNCIEDVAVEHGESLVGELTEENVTREESVGSTEDDWVKIKVPEVARSSVSDKISADQVKNVQDLYEATAQISDADPCSLLTIRLLSLQDKGQVYVDEVYVFVDPVESTDSGKEAVLTGYSAQSSLMTMFIPTLLQLSKSGDKQIQDKHPSGKVLKDDYMETGSTRIGEKTENGSTTIDEKTENGSTRIDQKAEKRSSKIDEKTENGSTRIDEEIQTGSGRIDEIDVGLEINQIHQQYVKPKELDKDTVESFELEQSTLAKKCVEPLNVNDMPPGHLGRALEQLISRMSRVEDICLRFEEKMLKPIENIEARLQQVEHQLENIAKNSKFSGLPSGTRFSAPPFSCSESNSTSFYNDRNDHPRCGPSELGKKDFSCNNSPQLSHDAKFHASLFVRAPDFSCGEDEESNDDSKLLKNFSGNNMPELSHDANVHPSLVSRAPELSCGENEEGNNDSKTLKDSPRVEPQKTLSVDDALAAALNGFLSTARIHPAEQIQTSSGLSSKVDDENQSDEHVESCQIKTQELPAAEDGSRESSQDAQVFTVKAPDFTAEETGNGEHLNATKSSLDRSSVIKNVDKDHNNDAVPPSYEIKSPSTSTDSCDLDENGIAHDFASAYNGDVAADSVEVSRTSASNRHLSVIDSYFEGETSCSHMEISNVTAPDLAMDFVEADKHQNHDETNLGKTDNEDIALQRVLGHESENVSEVLERKRCFNNDTPNVSESSPVSVLDFEFPILDVKFTADVHSKWPL
ncbi:hypothetical protein CDL12_00081 [Handroanthus impetiginosus]|uniref:Uncharacterized protein n=1 Tax=Handroanthus impetiginosus TaxID=429701 RepID=A0A2G9IBQ0_9LAMI|nr:hypothetical protein CDL12_00081 [Handroanthus impetiginosus]